MDSLAVDKHSSLLRKLVIYGRKKFYNIGTWSTKDWVGVERNGGAFFDPWFGDIDSVCKGLI
jgi:hypothetical protein